MKTYDRLYQLDTLLRQARYPVPMAQLTTELGCSRATMQRLLDELRDRYAAPLEYVRPSDTNLKGGWRYLPEAPHFELPGLWFSGEEVQALLVMDQLLSHLQTSTLGVKLTPLRTRLQKLLSTASHTTLAHKVRILEQAARPVGAAFASVAHALAQAQQLQLEYYSREHGTVSHRTVSPQRLVRYRDQWYVDAYCHSKQGLRTFAVASIKQAQVLNETAQLCDAAQLDVELGSSYGIFSGVPTHTAVLRFALNCRMISSW